MATITLPDVAAQRSVLTDELLARCAERAPGYDRDNAFFTEDLAELQAAGYLTLPVPPELGGAGLTLAEMARETRRLATAAAPTALGLNMHIYWLGIAADLWRAGDRSLEWMLTAAMDGAIFAAGHAEKGNDIPVLLSTTRAEKVDGGYRFTGHKHFGSLSPVWSFLGIHGMDLSDPAAPKIVHAFMPRDTHGYRITETWDTLGMRATRSEDTILDGAFVPDRFVARVVPAGAAGVDAFVLGIFAWGLLGFGNIYYGMAQRALEITVDAVKRKKSIGLSRPMAYHAGVQQAIADMAIELEAIGPHLEAVAQDWSDGVNHGAQWPAKITAAKYRAVEGSWKIIDTMLELAGGFGIFRASGIERLWRDARLGRIHPSNAMLTHEFVAKTVLGINPDEQPRWG